MTLEIVERFNDSDFFTFPGTLSVEKNVEIHARAFSSHKNLSKYQIK